MKKVIIGLVIGFLLALGANSYQSSITNSQSGSGFITGTFGKLLVTGQTTQYDSEADDGDYEKGLSRSYQTYTTGQYAGTTNITINGKTHALSNNCVFDNRTGLMWARYVPNANIGPATDGKLFYKQWTLAGESVTFAAAGKTITAAAGNPFDTDALCAGRKFTVSGTVSNDGTYTVAAIAGNVITTSEALVNEGPIATDFATVDDLIWDFKDQANTNTLGGHGDWRVPNFFELVSLYNAENTNPAINTTVFPSTPADYHWTGTTEKSDTTQAMTVYFTYIYCARKTKKTDKYYCRLVREGQ